MHCLLTLTSWSAYWVVNACICAHTNTRYHISNIKDILPVPKPFTTTIDKQISYFSGVRSSKSNFWQLSNHPRPTTNYYRQIEQKQYSSKQIMKAAMISGHIQQDPEWPRVKVKKPAIRWISKEDQLHKLNNKTFKTEKEALTARQEIWDKFIQEEGCK